MKRGTVILTPFPFTDLQGRKVRPAVIISSDTNRGDDVIIAFISSVYHPDRILETDYVIKKGEDGFSETGLKVTSVFKFDKIATIHKAIILGELGFVSKEIMQKFNDKIKVALSLW